MRTHVVMVPGFGGFDALGQLHYYAGVSTAFNRRSEPAVLHYFENLPTAAVPTRARCLEDFLVKLVKRRDVQQGDKIVLIGHSTGGLDIRYLLHELGRLQKSPSRARTRADARLNRDKQEPESIDPYQTLRDAIHRVVFLSVPHFGTNIADFVNANRKKVKALLWCLRHTPSFVGVGISIVRLLQRLTDQKSQLINEAITDVRNELKIPKNHPWHAAQARTAESELRLWRRHTASDFLAINDLVSRKREECPELDGIECLSFATVAPDPFGVEHDAATRSMYRVQRLARKQARLEWSSDVVFRFAFAACSAGPFDDVQRVPWLAGCAPVDHVKYDLPTSDGKAIVERWRNDGIVNTASMVCPRGETFLVPGDHADIIGHYEPVKADALETRPGEEPLPADMRRVYDAYDLLDSGSDFGDTHFDAVWNKAFEFALRPVGAEVRNRQDDRRDPRRDEAEHQDPAAQPARG